MLTRHRSTSRLVLAALAGALAVPRVFAAGPKTSTNTVVVDDLLTGTGGSVQATAPGATLDGGLGQTAVNAASNGGDSLESGYFSALVYDPTSPAAAEVDGSSVAFSWSVASNPSGTAYTVWMSTDSGFGGVLFSSSVYTLAGAVTGLKGNTTYYSRIQSAYSEGDDGSVVGIAGPLVTQAAAPAFGSIRDAGPFTLSLDWDPLSNTVGELAGAWTTVVATLPAVRQGQATLYYGGRLYMTGGADPAPQTTVLVAPTSGGNVGAWTVSTPLPAPRESHAMVEWGGRLYVAGGSDGSAQSTVWFAKIRADGSVGGWTATTPLPFPRKKLAMAVWNGMLVATGGEDDIGAKATVYWALINDDGTVNPWTSSVAPGFAAVSGHAMAVSSSTLYVTGGGTGGAATKVVLRSALTSAGPGAWIATEPLPAPLTRHAMVAANGKLYATGGSDGTFVHSTVYVGQISTDASVGYWISGPSLSPRFQHSLAATPDYLIASGGSDGSSALASIMSTPLSGTQSMTELASDAAFTTFVASSNWRMATAFDFAGLTPNTTYFARVSARSYAGVQTGFLVLGSTMTLAAAPASAASTFTAVEIGSITFQWTTNGNPVGTEFRAQACTASDFSCSVTMLTTPWLTAATTGFSGLALNAAYSVRVQARNANLVQSPFTVLGTTYTLAAPPSGSNMTGSSANSLTLAWGAGGNPPGTTYEAQVSTMASFAPLLQSSVTAAQTASFSGLLSASTFYAHVRALNGAGAPSGFDVVLSTATGLDAVAPGISTGTLAYPGAAADSLVAVWVAPGDDGYNSTLLSGAQFLVQWSTSDPAGVVWAPASAQVSVTTGPLVPGSRAGIVIPSLPDRKRVSLRVWTRDLAGNVSGASDVFQSTTTPFSLEALAGGGPFNAGSSPALVVDKAGNLHAAYRGTTATQELQYAKRTGGIWSAPQVVDPGVIVADVVLALDSSDRPVIAYADTATPQLKVARLNGSWLTGVVETGFFRPGGLAVDAAGSVNLSYYDAGGGTGLKFARSNGAGYSTSTVDGSSIGTGLNSSLALGANQEAHISYYDATSMTLKYASSTAGGSWVPQTVDGSDLNQGAACVIALDGEGRPGITYANSATGNVKFASMTASGLWLTRDVDSVGVGTRLGLALDGAGNPNISYSDRSSAVLKFAQWTGTAFSTQTVDASADDGLESALAVDGAGAVHIAYYDATNKGFKAAHWSAGAAGALGGSAGGRAQGPSSMSAAVLSVTSIQWSWTDNASNELGFRLYGSQTSTGPFTLIAGTATITASASSGGIKSFIETGLTAGTAYFRYAVAVTTGGFAAAGTVSAVPSNNTDTTAPIIVNNATGDDVPHRTNSTPYDVQFFDAGGSHLDRFWVKASTVPGGVGPDLIVFTTVTTGIASDSYQSPWLLPGAVFNALDPSVTNYISVQVFDGAGNTTVGTDLFHVFRDTTVPSVNGHVVEVSSQGITAVQIDCFDDAGSLQGTAFTQADGSGTYVLSGVPLGTFKLQATWTANGIGNSVSIDSITAGGPVDFTLQLNYSLATLQGTLATLAITNGGGSGSLASAARRRSAFFDPKSAPNPTEPRVELFRGSRQIGMVPVQSGGQWKIPNLLPGRYSVRAYNGLNYTNVQTVDLIDGEVHTLAFFDNPLPVETVYAFPNPARRSTVIRFFSLMFPLTAQIRIFDLAGNLVKEISDAQVQRPGSVAGVYHAPWDLTNSRGEGVASGVYLFSVKVAGGDNQSAVVTKKLAVVK